MLSLPKNYTHRHFFVLTFCQTNMGCKTLNFGHNLDISQTLLICAGYIDMNYDASRLSQNLKYDIQSTKRLPTSKGFQVAKYVVKRRKWARWKFLYLKRPQETHSPAPILRKPRRNRNCLFAGFTDFQEKRNLSWNFELSEYCLFIFVDYVSV